MLNKFLNLHILGRRFSSRCRTKTMAQPQQVAEENATVQKTCSVVKIVHVGGIVECYYMAIPAVDIMKKYPSHRLAKPEVFKRPWDSIVKSDEILTPGEKFYLVPRYTVRKLRRRNKKPTNREVNSLVSQSSIDIDINVSKDGLSSSKSFLKRNEISDSSEISGLFSAIRRKNGTASKKHVRFVGIDTTKQNNPCLPAIQNNNKQDEGNINGNNTKKKSHYESQGSGKGKRKPRSGVLWQPSLTAISERQGPGE